MVLSGRHRSSSYCWQQPKSTALMTRRPLPLAGLMWYSMLGYDPLMAKFDGLMSCHAWHATVQVRAAMQEHNKYCVAQQ